MNASRTMKSRRVYTTVTFHHEFRDRCIQSISIIDTSRRQDSLFRSSRSVVVDFSRSIRRRMLEQERDTFTVVRSPASLGQLVGGRSALAAMATSWIKKTYRCADVDRLDPGAERLLLLVRHRVSDDDFPQLAVVERINRIATQDAVRDNGNGLLCAVLDHDVGGLGQGAARVGHVVDDDGRLVLDVADEDHARHLVGARPLLVDEGEAQIQAVGDAGRALGPAGVGRHDHALLDVEVLADPAQGARLGIKVVDRHVEEALDLAGVQVHRDDVVAPGRLQHVGHELGRDGRARLVLLVLPRVREVWDHGGDAAGRRCLAGVDHDQQLHEPVVSARGLALLPKTLLGSAAHVVARRGRLQDEDIFVPDRFADGHRCLQARVLEHEQSRQFNAQPGAELVGLFRQSGHGGGIPISDELG